MKTIFALLAAFAVSSPVLAADDVVKFKIDGGIATGKASSRDQIKDDIALYFGKQKTPAVVKKLWEGDSSQTSSRRSSESSPHPGTVRRVAERESRKRIARTADDTYRKRL